MDKPPLLDLDFRTTYVENNVLYTPSKGSLVTRAVMGTGVVGNVNAPTITGIGASFDGGDHVAPGVVNLLDIAQPTTFVLRGRLVASASNQQLISNASAATQLALVRIDSTSSGLLFWLKDSTGSSALVYSNPMRFRLPATYTITYDGTGNSTGMTIYANGDNWVNSRSGSIASSPNSAANYVIGAHSTFGEKVANGTTIRRFQVYPFCMTAAQVRAIHERFEREGES